MSRMLFLLCISGTISSCVSNREVYYPFERMVTGNAVIVEKPDSVNNKIQIKISNNLQNSICLSKDLIENSMSYDMNIQLESKRIGIIKAADYGLIQAVIPGEIVLRSGDSISSSYDFDERFDLRRYKKNELEELRVRFRFNFLICDSRIWRSMDSGWQRIR